VVATAGTDVADCHPWLYFKKTGDLTGLIERVTVQLGRADRADDLRNRALRRGEILFREACRGQIPDVSGVCASCA
jgi:hypothetical protein